MLKRAKQNQKTPPFFKAIFESLQKVAFLQLGTKAHTELPWLFPYCGFRTPGACLIILIPKSARPAMCLSICSWVPFPLETGLSLGHSLVPGLCPNMESRAEKIPQYRYDSSLSCMIPVAPYLICSVNIYLVNIYLNT